MRLSNGKMFLSALVPVAFLLTGCPVRRDDPPPPKITVCIHQGAPGGGDCATPSGDSFEKAASDLENWWMISQDDAESFVNWCYRIESKELQREKAENKRLRELLKVFVPTAEIEQQIEEER